MEKDVLALNEIVQNKRTIEHPQHGTFVIRRPNFNIEAQIKTAEVRQVNADLQLRTVLEDPDRGTTREVPAILTRKARADQLNFHGLWTDKEIADVEEAVDAYREVCAQLEIAGFEGGWVLEEEIEELQTKLRAAVGDSELIKDVAPDLLDASTEEEFAKARSELSLRAKNPEVDDLLENAARVHRLVALYNKGIKAHADFVVRKVRELELFAETVESRAERAVQVAKVFYCAALPNGERPWNTTQELMSESTDKVRWLFSEIERFERMDPGESAEESRRKERFNFLLPRQLRDASVSVDSPVVDESNPDGALLEETPSDSTKDSDTTE